MTAIVKTIEKPMPNRQADTMFLKMVIECDCLDDDRLTILASIANLFFEQQQFAIEIEKQNINEGPNPRIFSNS